MKIAVMQPYFFPYIGYFQLISSVDKFIFYDDVNYIKSGWINRNNILINNQKKLITLNLEKSSSYKKINEIKAGTNNSKLFKTISQSYSKAPYFFNIIPILKSVFDEINENRIISHIAANSVNKVLEYLKINTIIEFSSVNYSDTTNLDRLERLVKICKINNATEYINAIGGKEIYSKQEFASHNINLNFLNSNINNYTQFNNDFISHLSIIDILMFNSKANVIKMLNNFTFE